ncbi:MAG TPA: SRPBCC family protein [Candidatus Saccharimonadales bacterium]|nr:SRPBCC family protein [Candidatus Saccharimonadales bacterium]
MNKTIVTAEEGKQELFITREFDAPRELVFKITTDPQYIPQWWGPRELTTEVEKADVKSGGQWRYIHTDKDGKKYGFHGVYHEVQSPSRIIDTFEFEGLPETGHVVLETAKYEELPEGRTKLTIQQVYQSVADRDGMVHSGMERGMSESHERLDELLATMKH